LNEDLLSEGVEYEQGIGFSQMSTPLKQMLQEVRRRKQEQVSREAQITDILKGKLDSSSELDTEEVQPRLYTEEGGNLPTLEGAEHPSSCCHGVYCSVL